MPQMMRRATDRCHAVLPDIGRPVMAKAVVQKVDIDWLRQIGAAIARARLVAGWSSKEAAAKVGVDPAEFGKWESGERRPHLDKIMAVDELRWPFIVSLASLDDDVRVVTEIRRLA